MNDITCEGEDGVEPRADDGEIVVPLKERIEAIARCWNGGEHPDDVLTDLFARRGRQNPTNSVSVLKRWDEFVEEQLASGNSEVRRLCREAGLLE